MPRRIARWILNGVTALAFLLCAASLVLWARSYRRVSDQWMLFFDVKHQEGRQTPEGAFISGLTTYRRWLAGSDRGTFFLSLSRGGGPLSPELKDFTLRHYQPANDDDPREARPLFKFVTPDAHAPAGLRDFSLSIHAGLVTLAVGILPAFRGVMWMHRRRAPGLCVTCGYDLRASPDRCPECGTERKSA